MPPNRPQIERIVLNDKPAETIEIKTAFKIGNDDYCRAAIAWGRSGYIVFINNNVHQNSPGYIEHGKNTVMSETQFKNYATGRKIKYCALCRTLDGAKKKVRYLFEFYLSNSEGVPFESLTDENNSPWYTVEKLELHLDGSYPINPITKTINTTSDVDGHIVGLFCQSNLIDSVKINLAAHYQKQCDDGSCVQVLGTNLRADWQGYLTHDHRITGSELKRFWDNKKSKILTNYPIIAMTKHDRSPSRRLDKLIRGAENISSIEEDVVYLDFV